MANHIPRYKETRNKVVKMCLSCHHVEELTESTIDCRICGSVGYLGFWETPQKFQRYVQMYKPKDLKVVGDHLQFIVDEALGNI